MHIVLCLLLQIPGASPSFDPARLIPASAMVYVEAPHLGEFLGRRGDEPFACALGASPLGALIEEGLDAEARKNLANLAEILGGSTADGLAHLAARGAGFGVTFRRGKPAFVACVRASDEAWLTAAIDRALELVVRESGIDASALEPNDENEGARTWYLGPLALAQRGDLLVLASSPGWLRDALDRDAGEEPESLAGSAPFVAARGARATDALVWAWMDVAALRSLNPKGSAEAQGSAEEKAPPADGDEAPLADLIAMGQDPGAHYLLGTPLARIAGASTWTLSARVEGSAFDIALRADGLTVPANLEPTGAPRALPAPADPGAECFDLVVHRDLSAIYQQRAELFRPEEVPQIARGFADLSLLFGGVDVAEELLPKLGPWLRVVGRPARFDANRTPEIELPAAALLVDLDDPETTAPQILAAFQTTVGVLNADRAQKRQQPLLLSVAREGDVEISVARPLAPRAGEGIDIVHNLVPACAHVGRTLILGTHESLVRELVQDLTAKRAPSDMRGDVRGERLLLRGPAVATYLVKNLDALVANNMLEKGHTAEEAQARTDALVTLTRTVERLELTTTTPIEHALELRARVQLTEPVSTRPAKTEPR